MEVAGVGARWQKAQRGEKAEEHGCESHDEVRGRRLNLLSGSLNVEGRLDTRSVQAAVEDTIDVRMRLVPDQCTILHCQAVGRDL